jgi:uncharacterized protein
MSRIIFWLALIFLVIFAIRSKIRSAQKRHQQQFRPPQQPQTPPQPQPGPQAGTPFSYKARAAEKAANDAEVMLQCAHCGVYYPAAETVRADGRDFCSAAHAALPAA